MLFNSVSFLLFFPVVCVGYFLLNGRQSSLKIFLLLASYFFYMNWEPFYALLILTSTVITYFCGIFIENCNDDKENSYNKRKIFLILSLILNFSILFFFKYYNFVTENIFALLSYCGVRVNFPHFKILLPVGISFYIFQAVGCSIDVYRRSIKAEKDFITYALFVSFFPQLVAGPIERAKNLLPQFHTSHPFKYENFSQGAKMMLWGYFLKLCVADRLSEYVDSVYNNVQMHSSLTLITATIFFTFQIYGDFAGYSLIAKGCAKCLGYELMENFRRPYLSLNVKEFWKRWHVSLSSWFADYVYISLGGNRVKFLRMLLNLLITFLISGLWHGASWNFVLWGLIHAIYLIIYNIIIHFFKAPLYKTPLSKALNIFITFILVAFAWIFFRSNNINDAFLIIKNIFTKGGEFFTGSLTVMLLSIVSLSILLLKSIKDEFHIPIKIFNNSNPIIRITAFTLLICYILLFGALNSHQFIYFQF